VAETRDGGKTWRLLPAPESGNEQCGVYIHDATTMMYLAQLWPLSGRLRSWSRNRAIAPAKLRGQTPAMASARRQVTIAS
jgi:hypothetical protein